MTVLREDVLPIREKADIVRIRQQVREWSGRLGFGLVEQTKLITAASELARNTLDHGGGGEMAMHEVEDGGRRGLRLRFADDGPGIPDVQRALQDGFSTGAGLGLGLSGASRLVNDFEIDSEPGARDPGDDHPVVVMSVDEETVRRPVPEDEACNPRRVHSSLSGSLHLRLHDLSQVGGARRAVTLLARRLGLDETSVGTAALAVTEVAKNLLQHADGGELALWWSPAGAAARDAGARGGGDGPGARHARRRRVASPTATRAPAPPAPASERCAARRRSSISTRRTGTARCCGSASAAAARGCRATPSNPPRWPHRPPGETAIGDAWAVAGSKGGITATVCDGLGHGPMAAEASREALRYFCDHPEESPEELVTGMHGALGKTRGAVAGVAHCDERFGRVRFAGVGNVAAVVEHAGERRHLVSHHGTLGRGAPQIQAFEADLPEDAVLVLHSDGINTRWKLDDYPGLALRHPGVVAGVLHRDFRRGRDDATVLVVRRRREREAPWKVS